MVQKRWRICLLYIVDGEGNKELGEKIGGEENVRYFFIENIIK